MRHIKNKHDWVYELRPQILVLISICGVLSQVLQTSPSIDMMVLSLSSVAVLLWCAYKISVWRKEYRRHLL